MDSDTAIIAAVHPYLDFINLWQPDFSEAALAEIEFLGIPLSKFGIMMAYNPSPDTISQTVEQVKALGLSGLSLFSINLENREFRGELARRVAEALYL